MKQETTERPEFFEGGREGSKFAGGFLLLMGAIFFLGMSEISILGYSPWMLMALIPAYWIGVAAYKYYRKDGRVSRRVFSMLVFGLLPFAYIGAAVLGLNVGAIWPIGLIAVGASFLLFGGKN